MTDLSQTYSTVTAAHAAIQAAGFTRDDRRSLWVHSDGRTARVQVRNDSVPGRYGYAFQIIVK